MKTLLVTIVIIVLLVAGTLGYIFSGAYDIAATSRDPRLVYWILNRTMEHSVQARARNITVPPEFNTIKTDRALPAFHEMCRVCHGAPGIKPEEIGLGLNPNPPDLQQAAGSLSPGALFWIIRNGIKMTGMPAFGPTHPTGMLWEIVAFVHQLPAMSSSEYKKKLKAVYRGKREKDHMHQESSAHVG